MNHAVVIVTYNRLHLLKECLACVCGQTIPFSRVIVVNNCSTDGTKEYLESREDVRVYGRDDVCENVCASKENDAFQEQEASSDADVTQIWLVNETENLGGAGGFYHGMEIAEKCDFDWVLLIDDDAMIAPDYMERLLAVAQGRSDCFSYAGAVFTEGRIDVSHRRRITNRLLYVEQNVPEEAYQQESFSCDEATFCGFLIQGDKMRSLGLPKKEYFLWYDDVEYCLRLSDCGGITVVPSAKLNHKTVLSKEGMVTKGVLHRISWRQYYGYRNRYDTARLHLGKWSAWCILWQYRIFWLLSLLLLHGKDRAQSRNNRKILGDIIRDCKSGQLGQHEEYHY